GSQQLMQPFAGTLARNGFIAVTFDCLGHGHNPQPMTGDVTKVEEGPTPALVREFGKVAAFAQGLPGNDGRIAVLGHSMASDIVIRYAQAHPEVAATVAVSMFSPVVTPTSPRNLAVIVGDNEPGKLKDEGRRVVSMVSGGTPDIGVTYGSFADGTARRVSFSPGVEHIGVLYSPESMRQARDWLDTAFGRNGNGYLDERGPALGLLFFGLTLLGWPLAGLLPRVSVPPTGAGLRWRRLLPVAIAPAILTPLILWKMPTNFLPILLGDYITMHFALYGLLTLAGLWLISRGGAPKQAKASPRPDYAVATWADKQPPKEATLIAPPPSNLMLPGPTTGVRTNEIVAINQRDRSLTLTTGASAPPPPPVQNARSTKKYLVAKYIVATLLVAAYSIFAFGVPLDRYVLSFSPIPERVPLILAVLAGTLPFFLADEWLTRGQGAARGSYPVTKLLFLLSLALAVALNFKKLFFLILIIPIILIFFIIYGLFSGWVNRRTGNPLVGGAAIALAFAWAIAVTFPLLRL
ncbi:MAG TPA: alpha/beta fold hydrolase, partial [Geobacterales bacterium]|nr:alpha/beta fold hydrolase [Geobacterales bacterium]